MEINMSLQHNVIEMGVYRISNTINHKVYIGSTKNLYHRIKHHINSLKNNKHYNIHLQRAFNKYNGEFEIDVIEYVYDQKKLIEREQFWINEYKSFDRNHGYNILPNAINSGSPLPDETKNKISAANKGKKHSNETKLKISNRLKGRKVKHSKETIEKIKNALKGHKPTHFGGSHPNSKLTESIVIEIYEEVKNGKSIKSLSELFNIHESVIYKIIKGEVWTHLNLKPIKRIPDGQILTEQDVYDIKIKLSQGSKIQELAKLYSVDRSTIEAIKNKKIWKHVLPNLVIDYEKQTPFKRKKLNINDVGKIKTLLFEGKSTKEISIQFNVSQRTIQEIKSGKSWKDVQVN
jgi:group I intron endonuclease